MKNRYLIRSLVNPILNYKIIHGGTTKEPNKITAEAVFQKCDEANANGQLFPKRVLASAIEDAREDIKNRHLLGELDHPDDIKDINRIATVSLKNASHVITNLELDGNYVVGTFETLETPNGLILSALLKDKIKTGVSIRAITDQDISYGTDTIDKINDFALITYDAVHNPAYSDAYVRSVMASVYKLTDDYKSKKVISITEDEFKDIITNAVIAAVKRIYKLSKN